MSEEEKRRDVPRLEPPLQAILLDEIAITVRNLTNVIKSTIPRGESPSFLRNITSELIDVKQSYPASWFSFSIHNYGPNSVYMGINEKPETDRKYSDEILSGEVREVDMRSARIEEIWLRCLPSETATVRVRGVY